MCGIFSIVGLKKVNINDLVLKQFMSQQHRGPDSSHLQRIQDNVVFGFHRLAIIDPHKRSNQPLIGSFSTLICNGEIYNYRELIQKYNFKPKTGSDCEVIVLLYEKFGMERTIQEIQGEFAFVLHDTKTNCTFAARDHVGVRRMKYHVDQSSSRIVFSSERVPGILDMSEFPPGHFFKISFAENVFDWCATNYVSTCRVFNEQESINYTRQRTCTEIRGLLTNAVKQMMHSDRPIGVLLSGGLDSSLIASLAVKYHNSKQKLLFFTIGLKDSVDVQWAKKVAAFLKIPKDQHIIYTFTPEEGIAAIPKVIERLGTCDITTIRASVPQYLLAKYIREHTNVKVILSGEGSDELFGGYRYSKDAPNADVLHQDAVSLINQISYFDCLRSDGTLAAHGLEMRAPFLYKPLVDFVLTKMPKEFRLYQLTADGHMLGKTILRDAFAPHACKIGEKSISDTKDVSKKQDCKCSGPKFVYLPHNILQRPKEAFSDAVSSKEVSWYKTLQKHVDTLISGQEFQNICGSGGGDSKTSDQKYFHPDYLKPTTKEALYYRMQYETYWGPVTEKTLPRFWMPKFQPESVLKSQDPSATVLPSF